MGFGENPPILAKSVPTSPLKVATSIKTQFLDRKRCRFLPKNHLLIRVNFWSAEGDRDYHKAMLVAGAGIDPTKDKMTVDCFEEKWMPCQLGILNYQVERKVLGKLGLHDTELPVVPSRGQPKSEVALAKAYSGENLICFTLTNLPTTWTSRLSNGLEDGLG